MGLIKDIREILGAKPRVNNELAAAEALARDWAARKSALEVQLGEAEAMSAKDRAKALEARDLDQAAKAQLVPDVLKVKINLAADMLDRAQADVQRIQDRLADIDTAQRWKDLDAALADRRSAMLDVIKQAEVLAKTMVAAQAAANRAYEVMPVKRIASPGSVPYDISPPWLDLSSEVSLVMAFASDGAVGKQVDRSLLWELRREKSVIDRMDANARDWLALSPYSYSPDQAA